MKLVDKFTIWFILITAIVLLAGGVLVFNRVQTEVDNEAIRRIKSHIDYIASQLRQGISPSALSGEYIQIVEIDKQLPEIRLQVYDTMAVYHPRIGALDRKLTVESSYHINDKHYKISMYDFVAEPDEIADGVRESLAWTFLILLLIVSVTNLVISRRILSPFHRTIAAMREFSLKGDKDLDLPDTKTKEFQQLNFFLERMTRKAQADYRSLKEFTENASHEVQTPLAVIRGKLELLLESPLNEQQGNQILSALNSIEKISRINHALTLLNKLENEEFAVTRPVNFAGRLRSILAEVSELIEMKALSLRTSLAEDVPVLLHPSLADILISNLLSNAIKHNHQNGEIEVILTPKSLTISNTGEDPQVSVDRAFERFTRTKNNNDSVGLGLAIVKQICDVSQLSVRYAYEKTRHTITVRFPS